MKKLISCLLMVVLCFGMLTGCGGEEVAPEDGISKAEFDNLKLGISEMEAIRLIGTLGDKTSEKSDDTIITRTYKIKGENGGEATLIFEQEIGTLNVELISKEQTKLK